MGLIGWVQNKLHRREEKKKFDAVVASPHYTSMPVMRNKEHNIEWPQHLLAIGTLGNSELKEEPQREDTPHDFNSSEDLSDSTIEEVNKLQRELKMLLSRKSKSKSNGTEVGEEDTVNLPLDRFLNCPSSLEVDRTASSNCECLASENNGDLSPNTKIILNKVKDVLLGNRDAIKKKSISFLFKKMFVCCNGFAPPLNLRDPIPESKMEKILRAILAKKICHHNSATTSSRKYLENKPKDQMMKKEEEDKKKAGSKWVKTDSEFIVLEIYGFI